MSLPKSKFFQSLSQADPSSLAIVGPGPQENTTYAELLQYASRLRGSLSSVRPGDRVAVLVNKTVHYPSALLGIWAAGGIAVPICTSHPVPEILYTLNDSGAKVMLVSKHFERHGAECRENLSNQLEVLRIEELLERESSKTKAAPELGEDEGALFIYTSGTTGKPKGAVHTHRSLCAQTSSLREAWKISKADRLLHVLPLHHIHGIVNALLTPLSSGGCVELADEKFDAHEVWNRLRASKDPITLFMAVPTIYTKLLASVPKGETTLKEMRLCVSGSAALPSSVKEQWRHHTGHTLLERYGMTEIGMGLSCGLKEEDRLDSSVGWPLPGVQAKLVDQDTEKEIKEDDTPGEIWISGDVLFKEYYKKPEQTAKEIVVEENGKRWFKTGDIALRSAANRGAYYIQGRSSVDIIKSGGYKISALDVERDLLQLPYIKEAAVLGVKDEEWGQRVGALITPAEGHEQLELKTIRDDLKKQIATYKVPTLMKIMKDGIPRNAMGKVNKKELIAEFDTKDPDSSKL